MWEDSERTISPLEQGGRSSSGSRMSPVLVHFLMPSILGRTRSKVRSKRPSSVPQCICTSGKQTRTDVQTGLLTQVGAGCPSWAAAPELQGVCLIFTKETSKTQEMFNEVTILAQNSP